MGTSAIQEQHDVILKTIKNITRGDWKVLVVDEDSKKIIDNAVKEDEILNENIANIELIDEKGREMNPDMDVIYILTPQPYMVDCLMADFERRRYRRTYIVWTSLLDALQRRRIDQSRQAQEQLADFQTLSIDYFPRESHLVTFRDPYSFPILYHPSCDTLVAGHLQTLAQKITGLCVTLGEYPKVRYHSPRNTSYEANVMCKYLGGMVQAELDAYAQYNQNWPAPSTRPQGILILTDRSMDLYAPLLHEFTYQAMAHDLLPIKDAGKVTYETVLNAGQNDEEVKQMEIGELDKIWVENRHRHMKDTIEKLMGDFQKFINDNPNFTDKNGDGTSINAIKDMMAGLPQFTKTKEAYSLHLTMAQECMNMFEQRKLLDLALAEQSMATGLDEDFRKPKNLADQVVRLLDDEAIAKEDRLRLIMMYIMYRDGVINVDVERLLAHSTLPPQDGEVISNLHFLGARMIKPTLKDNKPTSQPLFQRKVSPSQAGDEELTLSRYEPMLKLMLDDLAKGTLDQHAFPYTVPPLDNPEEQFHTQGSLRSTKPTWAKNRMSTVENRQRIIVFMAGGATYSESRACYESSKTTGRDVFLATSHMLDPKLFIRQISELSVDRRRLNLPVDRPKPKAPAYLFRANDPPPPQPKVMPPSQQQQQGMQRPMASPQNQQMNAPPNPPVAAMGNMNLGGGKEAVNGGGSGKLEKEKKEKKKRGFFGSKK